MLDDLFLEEKKLISASRASKEVGYTSDYIGQLCRQKKIPAKLVGRTWFVDVNALLKHKDEQSNNKKQKAKSNFLTSSVALKNYVATNRHLVQPRQATLDHAANLEGKTPHSSPEISRNHIEAIESERVRHIHPVLVLVGIAAIAIWSVTLVSGTVRGQLGTFLTALTAGVTPSAGTSTSQGIVIMNDSANHDAEIEQVKNTFSDDVTVIFDKDHESGVIQPIFRSGTQGDNYAFVLVPLKPKK